MDHIYSQSQLTIIAAAGDSAHHGLPGVNGIPRTPQRTCTLDANTEYVEILNPLRELQQSAWVTRAWTYQEGFLAARRLVFTNKEVFFVCNKTVCLESLQTPLQRSVPRSGNAWIEGLDDYFHLDNTLASTKSFSGVFRILANYTRRTLSFEADILNACTGMLNRLFRFHYWGVPILQDPRTFLLYMPLFWSGAERHDKRQEGFPSWSWTSVTYPTCYPSLGYEGLQNYTVFIRLATGNWERIDKLNEDCHSLSNSSIGPTLRIAGTFTTLFWGSGEFPYVLSSNDTRLCCKFFSDTELSDEDKEGEILALDMDDHPSRVPSGYNPFTFLVFQKVGRHYRRIGTAEASFPLRRDRSRPILGGAQKTIDII